MAKRTIPAGKGHAAITFQEGGLHRSLHVPQGQKIPVSKMQAALRGQYGAKAEKQARFYEEILRHGRQSDHPGSV